MITRREACIALLAATRLSAQNEPDTPNEPDSFRVYTDAPRLFLRPARLRLLQRERERSSLRWEQFDVLWAGGAQFPEQGWAAALRYQIAKDENAGHESVDWAAGPGTDIRQIALIADWCAPLMSNADKTRILAKLKRAVSGAAPRNIQEARDRTLAAIAISEAEPDTAEAALKQIYEYWNNGFIASIKAARNRVPNADAFAMMELLHAFRDNLNFDLRDKFRMWFRDYPVTHVMAHYPAPWPAGENEFRVPADEDIQKRGPDLDKAVLSRAAELAMVAYDTNASETQLVQGFLMNDRFLMRSTKGIPYEFLWANPYQPGLSYYHIPLVLHDAVGGQVFVRSDWEDDANWIGFFSGQLQLFAEGEITRLDPKLTHEPLDMDEATVFFAKDAKRFRVPVRDSNEPLDDVFLVGLDPKRSYHVEIENQEMQEEIADPGGVIYLPSIPAGALVLISPRPVT
jgi:hypothetical protein